MCEIRENVDTIRWEPTELTNVRFVTILSCLSCPFVSLLLSRAPTWALDRVFVALLWLLTVTLSGPMDNDLTYSSRHSIMFQPDESLSCGKNESRDLQGPCATQLASNDGWDLIKQYVRERKKSFLHWHTATHTYINVWWGLKGIVFKNIIHTHTHRNKIASFKRSVFCIRKNWKREREEEISLVDDPPTVCFEALFFFFFYLRWLLPPIKKRTTNVNERREVVLFNKQFRARHLEGGGGGDFNTNTKRNERKEIVISSLARTRSLSCRSLRRQSSFERWRVDKVSGGTAATEPTTTENWNDCTHQTKTTIR